VLVSFVEILSVYPDLVPEFQGLELFLAIQLVKGFIDGLKRFPSTEFVNPKGDVYGEVTSHSDGDDSHVVRFEPFVNIGLLEFLDVLKIFGGDNVVALFPEFDELVSDFR